MISTEASPGCGGHSPLLLGQHIDHTVGLVGLHVDGPNEQIVRNVVQVATVLQPGAGHRNVVGGALALSLR